MPTPTIFDYVEELRVILIDGRELVFKSSETYDLVSYISDDAITVSYNVMGENKVINQYVIPMRNVLYFNRQYTLKEDNNAV